ncbi:hypothetical protein SUDANB95_07905 (plasmid) [Actinosynnema sp. ALI-1.44]
MSTTVPLPSPTSNAAPGITAEPEHGTVPNPRADTLDPGQPVHHQLRTFEGRIQFLAQILRGTTMHFTPLLAMWLGCRLRRVQRAPAAEHVLTEAQARLLDLGVGTVVTRREGWLVPQADRHGRVHVAAITSLVFEPRLNLDDDALAELVAGREPLGTLTTGRRTTLAAYRLPGRPAAPHPAVMHGAPVHAVAVDDPWMPAPLPDGRDVPAMRSVGVLHRDGVPFALAAETVYDLAFDRIDVAAVASYMAPLIAGVA